MGLYASIIKPCLFAFDPESIHHFITKSGRLVNVPFVHRLAAKLMQVEHERLRVSAMGLNFDNPVGLAGGFDKDAIAIALFSSMGFGHIELGTVLRNRQPGNPKPRIFRLPDDSALINRVGCPSDGVEPFVNSIRNAKNIGAKLPVLGVNIGKGVETPLENAVEDFVPLFDRVSPEADYVVINISTPNTVGLRKLQAKERLVEIVSAVQARNTAGKPLLVKVAPDLSLEELDDVLEVALEWKLAGVIATNTALFRTGLKTPTAETGGMSGPPLKERAREMVRHIYERVGQKLTIIGVGGISTAEDVLEMVTRGASVTQLYTALVYQGPMLASTINRGIIAWMEREGVKSLDEIRGRQCEVPPLDIRPGMRELPIAI